VEFRILGPLEVLEDGRQIDIGGAKQRALLAILLLHTNEVVSTDRLIDTLWEDEPPETALKALQVYVSQLRKALGKERLETKVPGYRLNIDADELDLERFQHLADERPREALALWRGPPLAEFAYQRFAQAEIARLEELRLACLERRIEEDLEQGRDAALVGELERLMRDHPLRERLRAQLMLALYRSGRQAEALEVYQEARRALTEQLGIEPSQELRELQQAILRQDATLEVAPSSTDTSGADVPGGVFVGRENELDVLRSGLDAVLAGHGRVFLLVGEPGIGKSRLAEEVGREARRRGARVLVGRAWEAGGAPAYWPWVQSLRTLAGEVEADRLGGTLAVGLAELAELLPELRERFPDLPPPPETEVESARFRLFEAVSSLLAEASRAAPIMLALDDLHAADEPSLLMLRFVARELADARVLVVAAYRDIDPTPTDPLTVAVTELLREPVTHSIHLTGLQRQDVARFIELVSRETPSDDLVTTIHEETEGNPLFVGEIARLLATEGQPRTPDGSQLPIPQTVRDVIARRLRHLSEECNENLVLASVLGREFTTEVLARMANQRSEDLLETLDEAVAARVVSEVPGSATQLRFAHVLIRDALYEGLTVIRRTRLHRAAVEALEDVYGADHGPHLAELVFHAVAGSDFAKAVDYGRRAGDRALALLAYEEAARLYTIALDALELSESRSDVTRCELLLALGEAEGRAGDARSSKEAFLEASELARSLGLAHEFALAAAGYGGRIAWARGGSDSRLVPLLEEALQLLGDHAIELRARLQARLAGALRDERSRNRRDALSREAVELAREAGDLHALAYALDGRGPAIVAPDTIAECLELGNELIQVGQALGDRERAAHGYFLRFNAKVVAGHVAGALVDLDAEEGIAREIRQPAQLWQVVASRASLALAAGRLDEAEALVADALAHGERATPELALPAYRVQRYTLDEFRGTLDETHEPLDELARSYPARAVLGAFVAHAQMLQGRDDDARQRLDELAADDFAALNFDLEWLLSIALLTEVAVALGASEQGATLYRLLSPWAHLNVVDVPEAARGSASRYLGLLATLLGRHEEAASHFERAVEMNARMGAVSWLAHTLADYARMLQARDGSGAAEKAEQLHEQAVVTYRELGLTGPLARAQAAFIGS
jgi:DNA-binding SARP family transcriptional activator